MIQSTYRTIDFKLYLNKQQTATLSTWLATCAGVYNQALEDRITAYAETKNGLSYYTQTATLTQRRKYDEKLRNCPVMFAYDALRRIDFAMQAFFRRTTAGEKPGFPRFKSWKRYRSMRCLAAGNYFRGNRMFIPGLGLVPCRGGKQNTTGKQKSIRIIKRASGWYAQVSFECESVSRERARGEWVGIDVGLESFATLSTGEKIKNPRIHKKYQRKLARLQRRVARRRKGSRNREKAINRLAKRYEKIAARRKDHAHQISCNLVNRFAVLAYENLNMRGLVRANLAKHVLDAAWGQFIRFLVYKAEYAGKLAIAVDPRGTSQTYPACGAIRKKTLSERVHQCGNCGLTLDRDHAAALVILARAAEVAAANTPAEGTTADLSRKRRIKSAR